MKLRNKIIPLACAFGCSVIAATTLTSCGGLSKELAENMVDRKDGSKISDHVTFEQDVKAALNSSTGEEKFKKSIVDDLLFAWGKANIDKLGDDKKWKKWEKEINDSYKDKIQSYKDSHKSDWGYYFQNEVLDPIGGTEDLFKKNQYIEKIRSDFNSLVFKQSYLSLGSETDQSKYDLKDGEVIKSYNDDDLKANSGSWSRINFFAKSNDEYSSENPKTLDNQYARIQKMAFDEYTKNNMPISTAMALWKYGDPYGGIKSIYNEKKIKTSESFKPSYEFPAFSSNGGDVSQDPSTEEKFADFRDDLEANKFFLFDGADNGFIKTDLLLNYTEDSASTITTNLAHLYDDKASSAGGLETVFVTTVSQLVQEEAGIAEEAFKVPEVAINKAGGEKDLMTTFFSNDDTLSTNAKWKNLNTIFNVKPADEGFDLFATDSKYFTEKYRFATNTVRLTDSTGTKTPFMLTRDEFGVHLIGIDGAAYLGAAKTSGANAIVGEPWSQERENQLLKLRSILNIDPSGLKDEIKKYYDSNMDDLLFKIAMEDAGTSTDVNITKNKIFDSAKDVFNSDSIGKYEAAFSDLSNTKNKLKIYKEANEKIINHSKKYSDAYAPSRADDSKSSFASMYLTNGLATPLLLRSFNSDPGNNLYAQESRYSVTKFTEGLNNWKTGDVVLTTPNYKQKIKNQDDSINALISAYKITYKISNDGTAKYSENIMATSNSEYITKAINKALVAFNGDGNSASNMEKNWAFTQYLKDSDFSSYKDQILYQYYFPKMLGSDKRMVNFSLTTPPSKDGLVKFIDDWKTAEETISQTSDTSDTSLANEEQINWSLFQTSLLWLTKDNNKNLINYLRDQITWDNPGIVAWIDRDNAKLNPDFENLSNIDTANSLYDWSSNYMGQYDGVYTTSIAEKTTSFVEYPEYSSIAKMPLETIKSTNKNAEQTKIAAGFVGLQTSSNAAKLPAAIKDSIFGENGIYYTNPESNYLGTLYQFGKRELLIARVTGRSSAEINNLTEKVRKLCPTTSINEWANKTKENIFKVADSDIGDHVPGDTIPSFIKEKRFENGVKNTSIFTNTMFEGINNAGGKGVRELVNKQTKKHTFSDKDAASKSSRTAFLQVNYIDLYEDRDPIKQPTDSEYTNVTGRLNGIITNDVLKSITVQIAQDSTIQSRAVSDVILKVYGGKKVNVFTRFMNDQLGQTWVADWKKKI